ncbi:hypothetical protein ACS0TY_020800 [Phlomoides rotata]
MSIIVEGSTLSSPLVASTRFHESSYRIRSHNPFSFTFSNPKRNAKASMMYYSPQPLGIILLLPGSLHPPNNCDIYNVCGAHSICDIENTPNCRCLNKFKPKDPERWGLGDSSNECIRRTPLNCENEDSFSKYSGVKLPNNRCTWYNTTMTLEECKVKCLNNCSCTAYTSLNISRGKTGCLIWFGDLVDIREMTPGQDIYIRLRRKETKNTYSGIFPGNRNTSPKREPDVVFVEKKEVEASASGKRKDETEQHG